MNRYVSILLVSLLFLLIFNPINGLAAEQKISIVPSQQSTNIDQSFTIQIKAENFPSIRAAQLKVAYNPNLLEVEEVTRGDVFSSGMMLPVTIDNDKGEVIFGAMHLMERNSFTGQSGSLVTIQFRAIGSGNADIFLGREQTNTSLLIVDADGKEYSFSQTAVTNANVSLIGPTNNNSNPGLQPGPQPQQPPSGSAPTQPNINPEDIKSEIEQQIKEQYQEELEQFQKEKEQQAELKQPIFPDISGHWARNYIEELVKMNVLNGYEDGSFLPERTITRAEFAKMIVTALDLPSTSDALDFSDQDKIPTWARGYIAAAVGNEIIFGYDDKRGGFTFEHARNITRQEMAVMIARAIKEKNDSVSPSTFKDASNIQPWAKNEISTVSSLGIITGYPDGTFQPNQLATRGEAAKMISSLLQLQ